MLHYLTRILKKRGIFKRERRSTEIRALDNFILSWFR
jgi:hypothetical protein